MKKSDKLVLVSFLGPFVITFLITVFVLLMQFLWKYIDDLVGKGLEWYTVLHLLFYASASLVPLALPVATLLSMLMTMGSLGEHYELTALKTAGVSLTRIMRPLMIAAIFITISAFLFSNYIYPVSFLKFGSLLSDIQQQKPALNIKEGVFNNEIQGYSIRVGKKAPDNKTIYDVLIYDHTTSGSDDDVIYARKGEMSTTADKRYLVFTLYDGSEFQEEPQGPNGPQEHEQIRFSFVQWQKIFDLSQFKLARLGESFYKNDYRMLNMRQLDVAIDTFSNQLKKKQQTLNNYVTPYLYFMRPDFRAAMLKSTLPDEVKDSTYLSSIPGDEKMIVMQRAQTSVRGVKGFANIMSKDLDVTKDTLVRHKLEWWRKITFSLACLVLFFVGAPLGAIIRKGGLGMPIVIAVLMFVLLYVISISGEKLARDYAVSAFFGVWLPNFVLLPLGILFTYKATHDSQLFNIEVYQRFFRWISGLFGLKTS